MLQISVPSGPLPLWSCMFLFLTHRLLPRCFSAHWVFLTSLPFLTSFLNIVRQRETTESQTCFNRKWRVAAVSPDTGLLPSGGYPESAKLGPDAQRPGPLLPQFPHFRPSPGPWSPSCTACCLPLQSELTLPSKLKRTWNFPFPSTLSSHCSPGQLPGVTPRVSACQALWWDVKC